MKKIVSLLLALTMVLGLLAGCGGDVESAASEAESVASEAVETVEASTPEAAPVEEPAEEAAVSTVEESVAEPEEAAIPENPYSFPLEEPTTLTAWAMWIPGIEQFIDSPMDTQVAQEMQKLTNVTVEMTLASSPETAMTEINLIIASGDYPDLINNFAGYYSAGIDSAIENDVIVNINDYQEFLPNYFAKLSERGAVDDATSDGGNIGCVYQVNTSYDSAQSGLVLRQDWLEELGLEEAPTTYDELHDVLMQIKDAYGTTETIFIPKTGIPDTFFDGFGKGLNFIMNNEMGSAPWNYVETDDGLEVVFGFMDDSFYDALALLNQWYNDGLFSSDYLNHNYNVDVSDMTVGASACLYATQQTLNAGNTFEEHAWAAYPNISDTGEKIVAAADQYSAIAAQGYAITTTCENPELAAAYLDFQYTDDAYILNNYGVEGVSFDYNDKQEPVLSDLIMNNADGIPQAYAQFIWLSVTGSFYCDSDRFKSNYCEEAKACIDVWNSSYDYYESPYNTQNIQLSAEELEEYSKTFSDISTYCNEKVASFITGQTELTEASFDEFRGNIENMGINDCLALFQAAADRYVESMNQ